MTQMNLSVKQKQDRRHREQTGGCQGRGCEGWIGRLGLADVSFLYVGWINNKVLRYSTGNYQYPLINHNGKEYEKEYICITESLCCIAEINTI